MREPHLDLLASRNRVSTLDSEACLSVGCLPRAWGRAVSSRRVAPAGGLFPRRPRSFLIAGRIDIGIMSCEAQHPDLAFRGRAIRRSDVVGRAIGSGWPFRKRRLDPKVLDDLPIIIGSFMRTFARADVKPNPDFRLRVIAEADLFTAALAALYAGGRILVVPPSSVDRELGLPRNSWAHRLLALSVSRGLFHHRDRPLTQAGSNCWTDLIHQEVRRLCVSRSMIFCTGAARDRQI